jgi:hypothetical protein
MNAFNYRPSLAAGLAAWATFLVFLAGAAWLGAEHPDGFEWALAHDAAQAIAAAALALAGIGSIFEWRARKRWNSAIQVIAVDLLNTLIRDTGGVMSKTGGILLGNPSAVRQLDYAFQLPWTERSEERVKTQRAELTKRGLAALDDKADVKEMMDRLKASSQELRARSDRLRDAATALDAYVRGDQVMPLLAQIGWLHRRVQTLCDFADNPDEAQPAHVASAALKVLDTGLDVAAAIGDPVDQIRSEVENADLRAELDENELALEVHHAVDTYLEKAAKVADAAGKVEAEIERLNRRSQRSEEQADALRELEGDG